MDKDTPIFERVPSAHNGKVYRSKNFKVYDLKPGTSAYEFLIGECEPFCAAHVIFQL